MARNYCCCCDNRTAVKILGIISFISAGLSILQALGALAASAPVASSLFLQAAFQALLGWLLYAGVKQDKDGFLLGWLIFAGIGIATIALMAVAMLGFVLYIALSGMDIGKYAEDMKDVPIAGLAAGVVFVFGLVLAFQTWIFLLVKSVRRDIIEQRQMPLYVHMEKH